MKKYKYFSRYLISFLLLIGLINFQYSHAQTPVNITGDSLVCIGNIHNYTPDISDNSYNYHWSLIPSNSGLILTSNSTGLSVQWAMPGGAEIKLEITDPANNNAILYEGSKIINVTPLPNTYITSSYELACQSLDEDNEFHETPPEFDVNNCHLVCAYSGVTYDANGENGSTFEWEVSGAIFYAPSSGPSIDVSWGDVGFGEVKLIETTLSGCVVEKTICVEIVESPTAYFEKVGTNPDEDYIICLNSDLVLEDMSFGSASSPIVFYHWDWGDEHTSSMSPGASNTTISHNYDQVGVYKVTLTVTNACGCTDTYSRDVKVIEGEAPVIHCPSVVCENEKVYYSIDKEFVCSEDSWIVEGGTKVVISPYEISVVWDNVDPNTGFGYVMYNSCEPCPMTVVEPVPVILDSANIQGPEIICEGKQYVFRLPKWPTTEFNWTITGNADIDSTDQRNEIVVTANGPGPITLSCDYLNTLLKCAGNAELEINVLPQDSILGPEAVCQGSTDTFSLATTNIGEWTLSTYNNTFIASGTGNSFIYTFNNPGNYKLSVIGDDFCPPQNHYIEVVATPETPNLVIGPDSACINLPILYEAGTNMPNTSYKWSVGNPGAGIVYNDVGYSSYINFTTLPANINVVRFTTDELACVSDTFSYFVDVNIPSLEIFGSDTVCHSTTANYALNYTEGDYYEWEISDPELGSVIENQNEHNPKIQWNIPDGAGEEVWLKVKMSKCGVIYEDSLKVFVIGVPEILSITIQPNDTVCSGDMITLNINAFPSINGGSYQVNWGDGTIGNSLSHIYNTAGENTAIAFSPTLTITNPNGCLGTITETVQSPIVVKPAPVAVLSPAVSAILLCDIPTPQEVIATAITTGLAGSTEYEWHVPIGAYQPPLNSPINYNANMYGEYFVTVTNDITGCSSNSDTLEIIDQCPDTIFCPPPPYLNLSVQSLDCGYFEVNASVGPGATNYYWNTSNNITIQSQNSSTLTGYTTEAGSFMVLYIIEYADSCSFSEHVNIFVPYLPDLRYEVSCNQSGGNYNVNLFDHSSVYPLYTITQSEFYRLPNWDYLGNGSDVNVTQNAGTSVNYAQVISDGTQPACTSYVEVILPEFPVVEVDLDVNNTLFVPGCQEDVTHWLSYDIIAGNITSYYWDFGDYSYNASSENPIGKTYKYPGPVIPSLTVTDIYGCTAMDTVGLIIVANQMVGSLEADINPVCEGNPVELGYNDNFTPSPDLYTWYEQDNPLATTNASTYNVYTPGGYWVLGTNEYGCQITTNMEMVNFYPVLPIAIEGPSKACQNQEFTLYTQNYGNDYDYKWFESPDVINPIGTGSSLTLTLSQSGTHTYIVSMENTLTGCISWSDSFQVSVSTPPNLPDIDTSLINCDPYLVELTASSTSAGTYHWSNGMTGDIIHTNIGGDYQVTFTDLNGCKVQNSITVAKSLEEYIWIFPTGCICKVVSGYMIGPLIPFTEWKWIKDGTSVSSGSGYMNVYPPVSNGTYQMFLKNEYCEIMSDELYLQSGDCNKDAEPTPQGFTINNQLDHNHLALIPNPAKGQVQIMYGFVDKAKYYTIEIIDITGRSIELHTVEEQNGSLQINLNTYPAGMYQVIMRKDGQLVETKKLSVQK